MNTQSPVLEGYLTETQFAASIGRNIRTVRRWRHEADGLPYTRLGREVLIHVETAREWLFGRMQRPAPRRTPERRRAA